LFEEKTLAGGRNIVLVRAQSPNGKVEGVVGEICYLYNTGMAGQILIVLFVLETFREPRLIVLDGGSDTPW